MQNVTTITVDKNFDMGESNAVIIDEEVLEILPINSKEGQLFQFVDGNKKKGVLLRLKRCQAKGLLLRLKRYTLSNGIQTTSEFSPKIK